MRVQVAMTLPFEAASVPMARHSVAAALRTARVTSDCIHEVEVALSEACTNVLQHAGEGQAYEVTIKIVDQQLTVDVLDSGQGFDETPAEPPGMADVAAEEGRGLALIQALTDRAVFDSVSGGGGRVQLRKTLRRTEAPDRAQEAQAATAALAQGWEALAPEAPTAGGQTTERAAAPRSGAFM
jgi:serine/threonine-protein kinase RsbW